MNCLPQFLLNSPVESGPLIARKECQPVKCIAANHL